jgi:hypothetical protein
MIKNDSYTLAKFYKNMLDHENFEIDQGDLKKYCFKNKCNHQKIDFLLRLIQPSKNYSLANATKDNSLIFKTLQSSFKFSATFLLNSDFKLNHKSEKDSLVIIKALSKKWDSVKYYLKFLPLGSIMQLCFSKEYLVIELDLEPSKPFYLEKSKLYAYKKSRTPLPLAKLDDLEEIHKILKASIILEQNNNGKR